MTARVVITGIGVVSPIGVGKPAFWTGCLEDRAAAEPIPEDWRRFSDLSSTVWSPLPEVTLLPELVGRVEAKQLDPVSLNALHAAFEAVEDAGFSVEATDEKHRLFRLKDTDPDLIGVYLGTGVGGVHTVGASHAHQICAPLVNKIKEHRDRASAELRPEVDVILSELEAGLRFPKRFNPFAVSMLMPNAPAANIAIKLGITGPNLTYPLACASGTAAVGHGFRAVRRGEVKVALTGGAEYLFDAFGTIFRAFDVVKTLAHGCDSPETANRPFDARRSGFLFSQGGAAVLVLEDREHALARGAEPIAEIVSYAETCDARSIMMMDPSATQIMRMLRMLFERCDIRADQVDYVNAHGTGTELNDAIEAKVIGEVFRRDVRVNSTKALIGHTMGASGAIEAVVTALSLQHRAVHGSPNLEEPIADLNFIRSAEAADIQTAVSQSFAFGGHNTALLMTRA